MQPIGYRSLRFFEGLDELRKYIEPTFKDMIVSQSDNFKRVFRHTYKDNWYEGDTGFIQITVECGSDRPQPQKELSWFKRIFK